MAIYNAYLEGAEREAAIFNMEINNQYEKLSLLYEMSCMELDQVKKDIELKVFKESGTYDDYEYLISEAEAQAAQDQGSILIQIFDWFRNLLNKIITGIKNFFTGNKVDPNADVEVIDDPNAQKQTGVFNEIMKTINGAQDQNGVLGLPTALSGVLTAVAAGATIGGIFMLNRAAKKKKAKAKDVIAEENACSKNAAAMLDGINKLDKVKESLQGVPVIGQIITTITDVCGNYLKPIATFFMEKSSYLQEVLKTAGQTVKDVAGNVKNAVTGGKPADATATPAAPADGQAAGASAVKTATLNTSKTGIVASVNENGKPRKINLTGEGVITNAEDKQPISPALKQLIEGSPQVAEAKARYAKAKELLAKKAQQSTTASPAQPAGNQTATPAAPAKESFEEFQMELGDDYTLEMVDDDIVININTVIECPEDYLSTTQSIFGMIAEEEAAEDPELDELQKLFEEL